MVQALLQGDLQRYLQLSQNLENELSPGCRIALAQSQQLQNPQPSGGGAYSLPGVYDHGGGTYSVPGVGACGSGGCVPFD